MTKQSFSYRWNNRSLLVCVVYYAIAITTMLLEYLSESEKLSRGAFTDTVGPFFFSGLVTWPSSVLLASWGGYPERFSGPEWQTLLNDALPSYIWSALVQALLIFFCIEGLHMVIRLRAAKRGGARRSGSGN